MIGGYCIKKYVYFSNTYKTGVGYSSKAGGTSGFGLERR
jgi:hypothetical protein